ncbi:MAG: hypothetical protein Tsb002_02070 [Wenzhouxiangellaceae bacterium]
MNEKRKSDQPADTATKTEDNQIRDLFILAALWLPLGFFLWFYLSSILVAPVMLISNLAFQWFAPELVHGMVQQDFRIIAHVPVISGPLGDGADGVLTNPLIYGYGVPLLFGLVMATPPLNWKQRGGQIVLGYALMVLVQSWGVFWEILKNLSFSLGPRAAGAIDDLGLSKTLIALCYQLGYLILPAVVPIALWILFNRRFLEGVARR